ncbi:hypothetical protein EJB05_26816, partial [Eragrostis curvula]
MAGRNTYGDYRRGFGAGRFGRGTGRTGSREGFGGRNDNYGRGRGHTGGRGYEHERDWHENQNLGPQFPRENHGGNMGPQFPKENHGGNMQDQLYRDQRERELNLHNSQNRGTWPSNDKSIDNQNFAGGSNMEDKQKWVPKDHKRGADQDTSLKSESVNEVTETQKKNMQTRHPAGGEGSNQHANTARRNVVLCKNCLKEGHNEEECEEPKPWDYLPQFCGSAVPGQGFYYIEDTSCEQNNKDMETMAIIEVKQGEVTAKQIEYEFKTLAGPGSTWRWYARKTGDKQFQMRFPTAKKVEEASHFIEMRLRSVPSVVIEIKWTPGIGAKGQLDEAWFRIKGIPMEKRSKPNVCRVGALVGLSLEVDIENLKKFDYVRVKIGCRDTNKVPAVVEGALGTHFHDFFFQKETAYVNMRPLEPQQNVGTAVGGTETIAMSDEESEDEGLKIEDLVLPGSEVLNVGQCYTSELSEDSRKLSSFQHNAMHSFVINEYGTNLFRSKFDPLAAIEAKIAIENASRQISLNEDSSDKQMDTQVVEEVRVEEKASSPSPARGTQESPQVDISSQEEMNESQEKLTEEKTIEVLFWQPSQKQQLKNKEDIATQQNSEHEAQESEKSEDSQKNSETSEVTAPGKNEDEQKEKRKPRQKMVIDQDKIRKSDRLRNQAGTIAAKAEELTKKKNLEGTNLNSSNSFAVLSNTELLNKSACMGIKINVNDMEKIDIIKDMEIARHALENKKDQPEVVPVEETESAAPSVDQQLFEWYSENSEDDDEGFQLVSSRKSKKKKKKVNFVGSREKYLASPVEMAKATEKLLRAKP